MTLDASTPEKLRDAIVASLREAKDGWKKGSDVWLAFEYFSDYLANATLVTPKTREVWLAKDGIGCVHVLLYKEDVEFHRQIGFSSIVPATLTLHEAEMAYEKCFTCGCFGHSMEDCTGHIWKEVNAADLCPDRVSVVCEICRVSGERDNSDGSVFYPAS